MSKDMTKRTLLSTLSIAAMMMGTTVVHGEEDVKNKEERNTFLMDEVVVMAQKRSASVQDVPIAITAFSGRQMEQLGFDNSTDIVRMSVGVQLVSPNGGTSNFFTIRGVSQNDFIDHQESPVATYVDEVYISQMSGTSFLLFDLERVEILKGPQGTLFGRNATGGLVHFTTRKPSQESSGYVDLSYGSFNDVNINAAVGGALSETVSFRLSASLNDSDPSIENRVGKGLREKSSRAGRFQLLVEPSDRTSLLLNVRGAVTDVTGISYGHSAARDDGTYLPADEDFWGTGPGNDLVGYHDAVGDPFAGDWDEAGFNRIDMVGATVTLRHDMDDFSIVSVTDYNTLKKDFKEDSDATPVNFLNFFLQSDVKQFSQELRLEGSQDKIDWIVGAYFLNIDGNYVNGIDFLESALGGDPADDIALRSPWTTDTRAWSLFGHISYELSDTLELQVGVRWNEEKKTHVYEQTVVAAGDYSDVLLSVQQVDLEQKKGDWSGEISLNYRPNDDLLIYGGIRRGLKSGGFNAPLELVDLLSDDEYGFDQEVLYSYEVGFKADFPEQHARLNASAFYYDYQDYQAFNFQGLTQTVFNQDITIYGMEAELTLNPVDGLDIMAGFAYLNAEAPDGSKISYAPELNLTGLVRYGWNVSGGEVSLQADGSYVSDHYFSMNNLETVKEAGYALFNARIGFESEDQTWEVSAMVKNIFNKAYRVYGIDVSSLGFVEHYVGDPRTYSVNLKYNF